MPSMDEIYRAYSQTVYRYLLSLTRSADLAEELTQETFYQAVKSAECFNGKSKMSTWLCAIAKNCLFSYWRKHPQSQELDELSAASPSPELEVLEKAEQLELMRLLHSFEPEQREVMYLRLLGELSFREIGDILSRSENWSRVTYYRGKEKLKKELSKDGQ